MKKNKNKTNKPDKNENKYLIFFKKILFILGLMKIYEDKLVVRLCIIYFIFHRSRN